MTNIVPIRRRDSAAPLRAMPHALPVLARLPRIVLTASAAGSPLVSGMETAADDQSTMPPGNPHAAWQGYPGSPVAEHVSSPQEENTRNQGVSRFRVDSSHLPVGQQQPAELDYTPTSLAQTSHRDAPTPETHGPSGAGQPETEKESFWPRNRTVRKVAMMSMAGVLVLAPLYFLLRSSPTQNQPESATWPTQDLGSQAAFDDEHVQRPSSGPSQFDQPAERFAQQPGEDGRPYAPKFSGASEIQREVDKVVRSEEAGSSVPASDPRVELGPIRNADLRGNDERNRSSLY